MLRPAHPTRGEGGPRAIIHLSRSRVHIGISSGNICHWPAVAFPHPRRERLAAARAEPARRLGRRCQRRRIAIYSMLMPSSRNSRTPRLVLPYCARVAIAISTTYCRHLLPRPLHRHVLPSDGGNDNQHHWLEGEDQELDIVVQTRRAVPADEVQHDGGNDDVTE